MAKNQETEEAVNDMLGTIVPRRTRTERSYRGRGGRWLWRFCKVLEAVGRGFAAHLDLSWDTLVEVDELNIVEQTRRRWRMELYKMRLLDSCSMSGATRPQKVDVCKLLHN